MNLLTWIILLALLAELLIHFWADLLNLGCLSETIPKSFQDTYDADKYQTSQAYLKAHTRFSWIESFVNLMVILIFWFGHGFQFLDQWLRGFGFPSTCAGILFIAILSALRSTIGLPFSLYATFVIEARFGFNKTTWQTFCLDRLKGLILGLVLGVPLLWGVLSFFEYAGSNAWWYCWITVTLFTLILQFIGPRWIMPLFNKFQPLESGELKSAILSYASRIRFPLSNVFVMDGSKRSAKSNAFFTGFGKNKRIVLFDTLMSHTTTAELVAILGHEMGHYKKKHILMTTGIGIIHTGILFFLLSIFISLPELFEAFFVTQPSVYAGMLFFGMLYSPVELLIGIMMQIFSRRNEYQADHFAIETTRNPNALVSALKKLSVHNLSNLTPHPFYVFINYSHPPILKRIKAILDADWRGI